MTPRTIKALLASALLVACGGRTAPPASSPPPLDVDASVVSAAPPPVPELDAAPPPLPSTPAPVAAASTPPVPASPPDADAGPSFDMTVVNAVYKQHKDPLRIACWDHSPSTEKAYLGKATIRLSPTGKVLSSTTEGTDAAASACVDKQIKKWKFPPPGGTGTIVLPIHLHRD